MKMTIRTKFKNLTPPAVLDQSKGKSLTRQEFKDECNIASIVQRFTQTGVFYDPLGPMASTIRRGRPRLPEFLDTTMIQTPQQIFDFVEDAHSHFDALPARLKAVFNNSAEAFVAAINDRSIIGALVQQGKLPPDLFGAATVSSVPGKEEEKSSELSK